MGRARAGGREGEGGAKGEGGGAGGGAGSTVVAAAVAAVPPPLVFLFQSNPFRADDARDGWLSKLHRTQRQEVEGALCGEGAGGGGGSGSGRGEEHGDDITGDGDDGGNAGGAGGIDGVSDIGGLGDIVNSVDGDGEGDGADAGGVFLVDDGVSLYGALSCFRADEIHFFEPVKLVEGKMLWHLLALADQ